MNILNKNNGFLMAGVLVAGALASCSSNEDGVMPNDGKGRLSVTIGTETQFATRALNEGDWRNTANYTVEILDAGGQNVGTYSAAQLPDEIELENGSYTVHAYYGEEKAASRTTFLSEGSTNVALNVGDEPKSVTVNCLPTCGKVQAKFGTDMATYYSDYYVTYSSPKMDAGTEATWAKTDTEPWYLAVSKDGDMVTATIHLTPTEEYVTDESMTTEGTIVRTYKLERDKAWTLNIAPQYDTAKGTLGVTITVDESTNDQEVDVVIPAEWI